MTAPVVVFGALRTTLLITGGVFVAAGAGTDAAVATGATGCPVDTTAGNEVAAPGTPSSRRAAASITHDTGDCTGDAGPLPNSGAHTDSTRPDAAAGFGGAASITGWAATGEATTSGTDTTAGTDPTAGPGTAARAVCRSPPGTGAPGAGASKTGPVAAYASAVTALGDARRSPGSGCGVKADGAGTATRASRSPVLLSWGVAGACGGALSSWLLRRGVAATGEGTAAGSSVAEAGVSASRGDRVTPVRAGDRRDGGGVEADSLDESALSVDGDESAGAAHAVPPPLMAAPTPSATAKPPTRPTNADAPNWLAPPDQPAPSCVSKRIIADRQP